MEFLWMHEAAVAAERRGSGRRAVKIAMTITKEGIRVTGEARERVSAVLVSWQEIAQCRINPLTLAIDRACAAITGAEDDALRRWTGDPSIVQERAERRLP